MYIIIKINESKLREDFLRDLGSITKIAIDIALTALEQNRINSVTANS